jgi:hypothetical protein
MCVFVSGKKGEAGHPLMVDAACPQPRDEISRLSTKGRLTVNAE